MKNKLFTLSVFGAVVLTSQFANAATNIDFIGAASEAEAYKWSSETDGAPWVGGVRPNDYDNYITFAGVAGGGNEGFIEIDSNRMKTEGIYIGENAANKTINFVYSTPATQAYFNGLYNNGYGATVRFYTTNNVTALVSANSSGTIKLDTDVDNGQFTLEIGKGATFTAATNQLNINNNTIEGGTKGQLILKDGGNFDYNQRLNINQNGVLSYPILTKHSDIVINAGSNFTVKTLGLYKGVGFTVDGTLNMTSSTVINDMVVIDLGDEGTVSFGAVTFGSGSDVRIYDFRNEAVSLSSISGGDLKNFLRWDGDKWISDFTLVDGFLYSANITVPEPAEWAAIFGAIALSLAIYRRRK